MKRQILSLLASAILTGAVQAQDVKPATAPPGTPAMPAAPAPTDFSKIFKNDSEKFGYAIGVSTGSGLKANLKRADLDVDMEFMMRGIKESLASGPALITEDQEKEVLADLQKVIREKMAEKQKAQAEEQKVKGEKNLKEGPAFLAENKKVPGVITTASGLQYKVITEGTGVMPKADDEVTVNYRGTLLDGTEFDNSMKRGKPFTTKVSGGVIKGWTEMLQLMKTGSKVQVFIPSELAYGASAMGPQIAPNSVLIFDMELLSVQPGQPAPTPQPSANIIHPASAPLTSDIIKVPSADEIKKGAKIETIKAEDLEKEKAKAAGN